MIDDLHNYERGRRAPDQSQRFQRHDDAHTGRVPPHRRARPWILVGLALALGAAFVLMVATDDGELDEPIGRGAATLAG